MNPKILFVDDDEKVLESIENQLFAKLGEWDQSFANSAEKALALLQETEFDVVVSDMRMPGMTGSEFLAQVRDQFPNSIRIVLSGHGVPEVAIAAIPYAHQYLTKPCKQETLIAVIENALKIRDMSDDSDIRLGVSKVMDLPTHLGVYTELVSVMDSEYTDFEDIAAVIEKDPSLLTKVMFVANSALFATTTPAESAYEAVQRLGGEALKMLVLAVEMSGLVNEETDENRERQERIRSIVTLLLQDHQRHQMAGTIASILQNLGFMVFTNFITERYQQKVMSQAANKRHRVQLEVEEFGVNYAQLGASLLQLWRLPQPVVDAVANQHSDNPQDFVDAPVSASLMLADFVVEDDDPEEHIESALMLLPETEQAEWQDKIDVFLAVS